MSVRFGDFTLDVDSRQLHRDRESLHLSRKAFDALCVLVERFPKAVGKDELHARLWPGTYVVDANLSVVVAEVRRVLGDDPQAPRFIRTVHRIGYAFCADVAPVREAGHADPRAWLVWNDCVVGLQPGENLVGRDPACRLWLDVSGVSRRHANVRVADASVVVEDLGSKNGTFVGGVRLADARALDDGDRVRFGPVDVEFRAGSSGRDTETVRIATRRP